VGRVRIAVARRAVVLDRDEEVSVLAYRRNGDRSSLDAPRDAVLDGVLRQRLQQKVGNHGAQQVRRNVQPSAKTLAEANLLDLEIPLQVVGFLAERHLRSMRILRGATQEFAESDDHAQRFIVAPIAHQAGDGIERVVHEVRFHLSAQCGELRRRELLGEPRRLGGLARDAFACVGEMGDRQDQGIHDEKREGLEDERRAEGVDERRPGAIAPRIEQHLEPGGPRFGNCTDNRERRDVHGERPYAGVANDRTAAREADDGRRRERPRQPDRKLGREQRKPRLVAAFRVHDEDRLTRVDQPARGPDGSDPRPADAAFGEASSDHGESIPNGSRRDAGDGANGRREAASGLGRSDLDP